MQFRNSAIRVTAPRATKKVYIKGWLYTAYSIITCKLLLLYYNVPY